MVPTPSSAVSFGGNYHRPPPYNRARQEALASLRERKGTPAPLTTNNELLTTDHAYLILVAVIIAIGTLFIWLFYYFMTGLK